MEYIAGKRPTTQSILELERGFRVHGTVQAVDMSNCMQEYVTSTSKVWRSVSERGQCHALGNSPKLYTPNPAAWR